MTPTILHVITGLGDGGAEGVLYRLCTNDSRNNHVVVSLMGLGKYGPLLIQDGIELHCLDMTMGTFSLHGLLRLWSLIRRIRPDVVQTWMYHSDLIGGIVARFAGVSEVVWGIRHTNLLEYSELSWFFLQYLCALFSWIVPKHIISCAVSAKKSHMSLGFDVNKIVVIHNGFSLSDFCPDSVSGELFRSSLGIGKDSLVLGMVGRFNPMKDHLNLLQAMSLLKSQGFNFKIILVGTGLHYDNIQLQEWVKSCNLEDELYLLGPRSDVKAVMNALDFHVLSSAFGEGFPNVLAEAMACGTPCITTDVGDAALVVGDTGWVVPASNPVALANSIKIAIKEPLVKRYERSRLARERISTHFPLAQMVERYSDTYRSLIKLP